MTTTAHLALPFIDAAQSQKHVTHNSALEILDALAQISALARGQTAPPASPNEGDRYLLGAGATGAFQGFDGHLAAWQAGAWNFCAPQAGWLAYVVAEKALLLFDGAAWNDVGEAVKGLDGLTHVAIGAAYDNVNAFLAKLDAALFTARGTGEGGTGDLRLTINKQAATNTASFLFQDGYSGRAETGLAGDDRFHIKVSADGAAWKEALIVESATGRFSAPSGRMHAASGADIADFVFTPGGDGQVSFYRVDAVPHYQNPRSAVVASVAGGAITLATATSNLFFDPIMVGVSYVRIWNVTKTPNQPAWVASAPDASTLQVHNVADVAGWSVGDAIQIGDPTSFTPNRCIAIDISPMLQNVLGAVFPQKALLMKLGITAANSSGGLAATPTGASGSFNGVNLPTDGAFVVGQVVVPCSVLSPISNSNLVFMRESATVDGTLGVALASSAAVYV